MTVLGDPATRRARTVDLPARLLGLESEYEIVRELGRGGSATVYLARERDRGRRVAIKVLHPVLATDEEMVARLAREARTLARLRHSRIVRLYGTRRLADGRLALVLKYAGEETLRRRLHAMGALEWRSTERILADIARALSYAHRAGVVHRDIKPENIYLDRERGIARLSDFGVAQVWAEETRITIAGGTLGTPAYMSPEQIEGVRLDGRSDLYGLGLIGYEMLTGHRPWEGESFPSVLYKQVHEALPPLSALCPNVPPPLLRAIERALAKQPEQRWASVDVFLDKLQRRHGGARRRPSVPRAAGWTAAGEPGARRPPPAPESTSTGAGTVPQDDTEARTLLYLPAHRSRFPIARSTVRVPPPVTASPAEPSARATPPGFVERVPPAEPLCSPVSVPVPVPVRSARRLVPIGVGEHGAIAAALALALLCAVLGAVLGERRGAMRALAAAPSTGAPPGTHAPAVELAAPPPTQATSKAVTLLVAEEGEPAPRTMPGMAEGGEPAASPSAMGRPRLAAGGAHTCAVTGAGRSYCWGENGRGQLGTGGAGWQSPPMPIQLRTPLLALAAGFMHSCALTATGEALCWGGNEHGQLGDGSRAPRPVPVAVAGGRRYAAVVAGLAHSCALADGGFAYCWGANESGQLGDDSRLERIEPVRTGGRHRFRGIAAGWSHTCAVTPGGIAYCWGDNDHGQLGDGSTTGRTVPTVVRGALTFRAIAAGGGHSCAVTAGGTLYCWGQNHFGQLGGARGEVQRVPVRVEFDEPIAHVSAGASHSCALTEAGLAYCWGRNSYGQLGDGTTIDRPRPVRVAGGLHFTAIASYGAHSCGTVTSGEIYCWGYNADGQIGDRTRANQLRPARVSIR